MGLLATFVGPSALSSISLTRSSYSVPGGDPCPAAGAELPFLSARSCGWERGRPCRNLSSCRDIWPTALSGLNSSRKIRGSVRDASARSQVSDAELDLDGQRIEDDYYAVLNLTPDASFDEIKRAYYSCMKACHPDLSGNDPESTAFCMFINEVYEVLSDPEMRSVYDEINGFALIAQNPFAVPATMDFAFVDEFSCIGCKNCANTAESTFEMEPLWGRARVCNQRADQPALVQEAIDTCPVNCIHWVSAQQLTLLEDEMRRMERVNVAMMLAGMGAKGNDVFAQASHRWEKRQARTVARARAKMAKEARKGVKKKQGSANMWGAFWSTTANSDAGVDSEDEEAPRADSAAAGSPSREAKMAQAAAAARRWREYSRSGVDRRATRALNAAREEREVSESVH